MDVSGPGRDSAFQRREILVAVLPRGPLCGLVLLAPQLDPADLPGDRLGQFAELEPADSLVRSQVLATERQDPFGGRGIRLVTRGEHDVGHEPDTATAERNPAFCREKLQPARTTKS